MSLWSLLMDYAVIWSLIETFLILILGAYLFFKDKGRYWRFFGYRPTAILVFIDYKTRRILLIQKEEDHYWSFSQGGLYCTNDYQTKACEIIERELALPKYLYKVRKFETLGTIKIENHFRMDRGKPLGYISIRSRQIGKAYIAIFIWADLERVANYKRIHPELGQEIEKAGIFSIEEARKLLSEGRTDERTDKKIEMFHTILDWVEIMIKEKKQHDKELRNGARRYEIEKVKQEIESHSVLFPKE